MDNHSASGNSNNNAFFLSGSHGFSTLNDPFVFTDNIWSFYDNGMLDPSILLEDHTDAIRPDPEPGSAAAPGEQKSAGKDSDVSDVLSPILEQMIRVYQADIEKQMKTSRTWFIEWGTCHTLFFKENMQVEYVEFTGRSVRQREIRATLGYRCNKSFKVCLIKKTFESLRDAFLWVWTFLEKYSLCKDCGSLLETGHECDSCLFFRGYMEWMKRTEICAICQEPVFRYCLPCGHMFHRLCMNKIEFSQTIRCPLCRLDIPYDVICDLFDKPRPSDDDIIICDDEDNDEEDEDDDENDDGNDDENTGDNNDN